MIEPKDITIDDKEIFDKYFEIKQYRTAEYSFADLFMWRNSFQIKYAIVDDFLCVFCQYEKEDPFVLMPVGNGDLCAVLAKLMEYFESQGNRLIIEGLTIEMKAEIEEVFPSQFTYEEKREYFEYVYQSTDLITLKGKKFHAKRNHINKFKATNNYTYAPLTKDNVEACKIAAIEWCRKRNCNEDKKLEEEKEAIIDALDNFERLQLKGGLLLVKSKIVAFTLGELHTKDMALIHVEKADADIQGAYPMINQLFCEREWSDVTYINREEDMGLPGLRKAKMSYRPVQLIEKYNAYRR